MGLIRPMGGDAAFTGAVLRIGTGRGKRLVAVLTVDGIVFYFLRRVTSFPSAFRAAVIICETFHLFPSTFAGFRGCSASEPDRNFAVRFAGQAPR